MTIAKTARASLTHGSLSNWVDQDMTGVLPAGSVGAIVHFKNTGGTTRVIGVRKNGSTDSTGVALLRAGNHAQFLVGLDGGDIFETFIDHGDVVIWLEGCIADATHAVFFTNKVSKTISANGTWQDIDISGDTGGDTAVGVVCEINHNDGSQISYGARKNGSTDARTTGAPQNHLSQYIVGCDGSEIFEAFFQNVAVTPALNIVGYFIGTWITFNTNATDVSKTTTGSFEDIPANHPAIIVQVHSSTDQNLELRCRGEAQDLYGDYQYGKGCIVVPGLAEGKIQTTNADFFITGFVPALACDAGAYAVAGGDATFSTLLACDGGAFAVAGADANLVQATPFTIACDAGAYSIAGADLAEDYQYTRYTQEVVYECAVTAIANAGSGTDWIDPANVLALDAAYARCTLAASGATKELDLTGLVPKAPGFRAMVSQALGDYTVAGISVTIQRRCHPDAGATARDVTVQRLDNGAAAGNNLADTGSDWPAARGAAMYGGGAAVWGALPTVQEILDGKFGLRIKAGNNSGAAATMPEIDDVLVELQIEQPALPPFREGLPPALGDVRLAEAANPISDLVRRRGRGDTDYIWLAELSNEDEETGEIEDLNWCSGPSGGMRFDLDDDGLVDTQYDAVLSQPLQGTYRGFTPSVLGRESTPSQFRLIALHNGSLTYLRNRRLEGRRIVIKLGAADLPYDSFRTLFTLIIRRKAVTRDAVTLEMEDRRCLFDASLHPAAARYPSTYAVTELRNAVMPFCVGIGRNVSGHGIGAAQFRLIGDLPFKEITETREDGDAISAPGTVDLTGGTATFAGLPAGKVTFDIKGAQPRNIVKDSRDATQATWTKTGCTASLLAFGFDGTAGKGFRLTASAPNATCIATAWENPASPQWPSAVKAVKARLVSGVGAFKIFDDATVFQAETTEDEFYVRTANPGATIGGITILNSGDVIEFDEAEITPGGWYPPPHIDTAGAGAAVAFYPDTLAAIVKLLGTTRAGMVTSIDFGEASFADIAQKSSAKMGWYWDKEQDLTVMQALAPFLEGGRCGLITDAQGRFMLRRTGKPEAAPVHVLHERNLYRESAADQPLPKVGRVLVEHAPNFTLQSEEFESGLSAAVREKYARPFVMAEAKDQTVLDALGETRSATVTIRTALDDTADAARLGGEWLEILTGERLPMTLHTGLGALVARPFDVVRVSAAGITYEEGGDREIADMEVLVMDIDGAAERVVLDGVGRILEGGG